MGLQFTIGVIITIQDLETHYMLKCDLFIGELILVGHFDGTQ